MKKPTSEFTPEHALPTESENVSCPWWSAKTPSPEPGAGGARCMRGARYAAAPLVAPWPGKRPRRKPERGGAAAGEQREPKRDRHAGAVHPRGPPQRQCRHGLVRGAAAAVARDQQSAEPEHARREKQRQRCLGNLVPGRAARGGDDV